MYFRLLQVLLNPILGINVYDFAKKVTINKTEKWTGLDYCFWLAVAANT